MVSYTTLNKLALATAGATFLALASLGMEAKAGTLGPDAFGYRATDAMDDFLFEDISRTGTRVLAGSDDGTTSANLGFNFNFYGTNYSSVFWNPNGLLTFGGSTGQYTNVNLGTSSPSVNLPSISALWDDWVFNDAAYYQTLGTLGNRRFIVQWNSARGYSTSPSTVTFQTVLFEKTNDILFSYLDVDSGDFRSFGGNATVGIRDTNGQLNGRNLQWSFNSPVIRNNQLICFSTSGCTSVGGNVAPTVTGFVLNGSNSDITINEGQSVSATISATDPGRYDDITFFLNGTNRGTDTTDTTGTRSIVTSLGTFSDNGSFTYNATSRDSDGAISNNSITRTVTVLNVAPTLFNFALSSYEIFEGQSISAFLEAIDPGADAISFLINGNSVGTNSATSGIRSLNVGLGFEDDGIFNITGQAKDDDGGLSSILSRSLKVLNVAPTINSLTSGLFGRQLNFTAVATDPGINDLLNFEWDFDGDGEYNDFFGSSGSWNFAKNGLYNIGLRVSDGDGGFAYKSLEVAVSVPESSSILGILALGAFGAGSTLKRKKGVKA
jgi:hypothetical protein